MILHRLGSKTVLARHSKLLSLFPPHEVFIDMFFGAGGLFFNKPQAKYNVCNDIDNEVFNFFMVIKEQKEKFIQELTITPRHSSLFKHWVKNEEEDPVLKAVRFIFLSNFSLYGTGTGTMKLSVDDNSKQLILDRINITFDLIQNVRFTNLDFRKVISSLSMGHGGKGRERIFIYADPPYLGTINNYGETFKKVKFSLKDTEELFDILVNSGIRFALSELDNGFILNLAKKYNLEVFPLRKKIGIKRFQNEVLVVNYDVHVQPYNLWRQ